MLMPVVLLRRAFNPPTKQALVGNHEGWGKLLPIRGLDWDLHYIVYVDAKFLPLVM